MKLTQQSMTKTKAIIFMFALLFALIPYSATPAHAAGEITLFTPYKNITVQPGESINYSIDVSNNTSEIQNVALSVTGLPEGWTYTLTSGAWTIEEIGVKGGESETVRVEIEIPHNVEKGTYPFNILADGFTSLPLTVNISETGTYETEFTTDQANREGDADATFSYSMDLRNRTAEVQTYALNAEAPRGWDVAFILGSNHVTSAQVESDATQTITVQIDPPEGVTEGSYTIPVSASAGNTSSSTELEVVITGKYAMQLTTPKGLLSDEVTAGRSTKVELEVRNTGTTALTDVTLDFSAPLNWDVTFDKNTIDRIEAGETGKVIATIQSSDKAIPGDYVTSIVARTPEVSSQADFRIAVKTSMLWGWLGILIIAAVVAFIAWLFRKYGRR